MMLKNDGTLLLLKTPINSNTSTCLTPEKQPEVQMGQFQQNDVAATHRAHTSDVTFSKYQIQSTCYKW